MPEGQAAGAVNGKLAKGNIAGVSVANLTPVEAQRRARRELDKRLDTPVIVTDGFRRLKRTRRDLGVRLDLGWMLGRARSGQAYVPLRLAVDAPTAQRALRRLAPRFAFAGRNARIGEWKGKAVVTPHQAVRTVNVGASVPAFVDGIGKNAALRTWSLRVNAKAPRITTARFKGIDGVLGRYTTSFDPGNIKRTHNMRVAIRSIDGKFVAPGTTFSLNKTVGERTQARGYRTAIIFENGYKVPGIGAGVSQVTGTLFNAALVAGLPIVEYRTHSRPVAYLPVGRDATVSYGNFDMKFKNSTKAPVYISYKITGHRVTATLFGKKTPGRHVSVLVRSEPKGPRRIAAQLYRTYRQNGKVVLKQQVGTSSYAWKEQNWG